MRAGFKVSQMTQISSLLFHVPQIARIYTDFSLFGIESAGYLCTTLQRYEDGEGAIHSCSYLLMVAHTFS